jgi:tetratricopeptide (TPR) repeat protein
VSPGHLDLGRAYLERGRPDRAEEELRRALSQDPDDVECLTMLGFAVLGLGRSKEALELARQAVAADPEWCTPHLLLSHALTALERPKQAELPARTAIELDPEDVLCHGALAAALGAQRRWREALEAAERGLELDPESEGCGNLRARALIQLGKAGDADFALEGALRRNPEDSGTHENLGYAALHRGDARGALTHYREALRLDPTSDAARAGMVAALKARNVVYRVFLTFSLWLTRIPSGKVFLLMVVSVIVRSALLETAEANPALAPLVWTVLGGILAFILLTWLAEPLFNLLLRFDREGRQALDSVQLRQANWFAGWLALTVGALVLWLQGDRFDEMVPLVIGMLLLPVVTAAGAEGKGAKAILASTLVLAMVGGFAAIEDYRADRQAEPIMPYVERLSEAAQLDPELEREELLQWPDAEREAYLGLRVTLPVLKARRERAETAFNIFLYGFVAFTWLCGGILTTGTR